ncbi:MAG: PVC-type heme-binding CxxCH protein [Gemmataceae bacterium]
MQSFKSFCILSASVIPFHLSLIHDSKAQDLGLRVPPGFRVSLYADETLANDIYAMTLDARGRVVVTSRGWIKVLHDTKGVGKADKATIFAKTPTGGMGLCFDGNDLYFCGDGWLSRFRDKQGRGEADGPPEKLIPLNFEEHGGHAIRKGPDGWIYVIGGNSAGIDHRHVASPSSPIREPEAGALLRLTPDGKKCEVIAHGFRNPYDFDFNAAGDLFTYDSDNEEDTFLPWYMPTRLYHIGFGGHHGWRLKAFKRSWGRPDYYLDTVNMLWPVGRGSPTGVACYRHEQFPEHYRGGVFALDWTFGKVYFFPLQEEGASYKTKPEIFLESVGDNGFDPTDIVVAPDGSLFICIGGRGTRGAVYHVEYVGDGKSSKTARAKPANDLDAVLLAPQPLDAWSRAQWEPTARKLGAEPFIGVVIDEKCRPAERVRAIEVVTELFKGLSYHVSEQAAQAKSPLIRARVAWSLGRTFGDPGLLENLACKDIHPRVRLVTLDALVEHAHETPADDLVRAVQANTGHAEKRVRMAAARLGSLLPEDRWKSLGERLAKESAQARLTIALASVWRKPDSVFNQDVIDIAVTFLPSTQDADLRLQALRLIILGLGDFRLKDQSVEAYSAYTVLAPLKDNPKARTAILNAVRSAFPTTDDRVNLEASRVLAMLEDDDPTSLTKVARFWTEKGSPTQDMHYLVVFSRLQGRRSSEQTRQVAETVLGLTHKLDSRQLRTKQSWSTRVPEVVEQLCQRDRQLATALVRHPGFVNASHVTLANGLDQEHRRQAARMFLEAVKKDADFTWSIPLVDLLATLTAEEVRPVLRSQWANLGLRDPILLCLAKEPAPEDRERFLAGLDSPQHNVIGTCLRALERLPRDPDGSHLIPLLRLLRRLEAEPKERELPSQVFKLVSRQTGKSFVWKQEKAAATKADSQPIFDWFEKTHPDLLPRLNGGGENTAEWAKLLKAVDWDKGDPKHGETLFRDRACVTCHAGPTRLGPDLTGVTTRFSRDDLFTAIIDPSRDVAPAYRVTNVETKKGLVHSGIVIYESAEGVILQTGAATTNRIANQDIASRQPSTKSLMPDGLLKDLKAGDLADLYSYLKTLKPEK